MGSQPSTPRLLITLPCPKTLSVLMQEYVDSPTKNPEPPYLGPVDPPPAEIAQIITRNQSHNFQTLHSLPAAARSVSPQVDAVRAIEDLLYSLVEQVSPFLPSGVVHQWDKEDVARLVLETSNLDLSTFRHFQAASIRQVKSIREHRLQLPHALAFQILQLDPKLSRLRYKMVPGRVSESRFWSQFFEQLVLRLCDYIHGGLAFAMERAEQDKARALAKLKNEPHLTFEEEESQHSKEESDALSTASSSRYSVAMWPVVISGPEIKEEDFEEEEEQESPSILYGSSLPFGSVPVTKKEYTYGSD